MQSCHCPSDAAEGLCRMSEVPSIEECCCNIAEEVEGTEALPGTKSYIPTAEKCSSDNSTVVSAEKTA